MCVCKVMETDRPDSARISHLRLEAERARRISRQLSRDDDRQRLETYAEELERELAKLERHED